MNIEQFYAESADRRDSEELEFGTEWTDDAGNPCEVAWIENTGEVYVMTEVDVPRVEVLGHVGTRAEIERMLAGWPDAMRDDESLRWVRDRVAGRTHAQPGDAVKGRPRELDGAFEVPVLVDQHYRFKMTLVMALLTGTLAALLQFVFPRPDPVAAFIGCFFGMTIFYGFTPFGREQAENLQRSRAVRLQIGRSGQREVRRAVREGRAVNDPTLARYAVHRADLTSGFLKRGWVAASSVGVLWLIAVAVAEGRIVTAVVGLVFIGFFPIRLWVIRARRLERAEAALAANERLLAG